MKLRDFQAEDIAAIQANNYRAIVANAPGTGKTIECLECLNRDRVKLAPAVVVCPASVAVHWQREAKKWCPWATAHIVQGRSSSLPDKTPNIVIIPWSLLADRYLEIMGLQPMLLIADEAHYAKCPDSLRSQALSHIARTTPHILLLTGTPIVNTQQELGVLQGLFGEKPPIMVRRLIEDVAKDIPPKTRSILAVTLRPKAKAEYDRVEETFSKWLKAALASRMEAGEARAAAHRALAAEALVKIGYLRRTLASAKVRAAADWVGRAVRVGEPVVVFCEHRDVVEALQDLLRKQRIRFVTVAGATPKGKRQAAIDSFQKGEVPVFIGTRAAKEGITLTRARNLLFVERYYTSADEEQAEDRIRRIGQTHPTTIWFLHTPGTIDDRLTSIINNKRRIIKDAIGAAHIAESDRSAVIDLISAWGTHVGSPSKDELLGLDDVLPPLPAAWTVCKLLFRKGRWGRASAQRWAKMNGYPVRSVRESDKLVVLYTQRPSHFQKLSFGSERISNDIQAVVGERRIRKRSTSSKASRKTGAGRR